MAGSAEGRGGKVKALSRLVSRRSLLRAAPGLAMTAATATALPSSVPAAPRIARTRTQPGARAGPAASNDLLFRALDEHIEAAMSRYHIPGVAVGVFHDGREYLRGYGVTNVDDPRPVEENTLFRIGSTTKTFTGTTIMRLAEQAILDLNAPVRTYLPTLKLADPVVTETVTVRQLLNHSAGWVGDDYADLGRGEGALATYVAGMQQLPQLTTLGTVFAYNNAAVNLAGHLLATVSGKPYEDVVRTLLLDPLGLAHTGFFTDRLVGFSFAASHVVEDNRAVVEPSMWRFPESLHPTGGLISSARDQLRYARFHLGNGTTDDGAQVLSPQSLVEMRSHPGPGGTIQIEIDGVGITWWRRRTAQGVPAFQHGGSWQGQYSGLFFVPQHQFAMTVLTNSTGGPRLIHELFFTDWALRRFVGLSDPPGEPRAMPPAMLAPYEGRYRAWIIPPEEPRERFVGTSFEITGPPDPFVETAFEIKAANGGLQAKSEDLNLTLAFYRDDHVLATDQNGQVHRADFIRGPDGRIAWLRDGGRLFAHDS
jgi:CubicO group peptidase (beta-lactamase class C family)